MIRKDGNKAYGFVCNLSSKDEIYSVSKAVKQQVGNISILINNAGIVSGTSLLETPDGTYISIRGRGRLNTMLTSSICHSMIRAYYIFISSRKN